MSRYKQAFSEYPARADPLGLINGDVIVSTIRINRKLHAELKRRARHDKRSLSIMIEEILYNAMADKITAEQAARGQ